MASTRTTSPKRRAPRKGPQTPTRSLTALARHAAHIQIAAGATAANAFAQWAETADRFAQALADELLRRVDGDTDAAQMAARLTAAGTTHLCDVSALPRAAADHFDTRLARMSTHHKEVR
jgi:hypothetical protein